MFLGAMVAQTNGPQRLALLVGLSAAVLAAVGLLVLRGKLRAGGRAVSGAVAAVLTLPLLAAGAAAVLVAAGETPLLAVPLALFAGAPAAIVAMVVPQLLRDPSSTPRAR
ncbi:hypothetical protein BCF74_10123 [Knoellia remsis]|uniref:Uncharacterized protein n=1 Tax=Knoellia remsis TaxID=407159 RepID=A0A2T0V0B1_9MICO|nr:hypothetical protein BCF74_10123 [Knoellia remsis]